MKLKVEPTKNKSVPYDTQDDESMSFLEELAVTSNTINLLEQLGSPPEVSADDAQKTVELLEAALKNKNKKALSTPAVAYGAREFVKAYGISLAMEMSQVRTALTNKLLALANCGDTRYELKAIELLGKHSDIALFTERSEVTINYKNADDLEDAIKERVKRLLNATEVEGVVLSSESLDDELGFATVIEQEDPMYATPVEKPGNITQELADGIEETQNAA
jgi:hypothetical protein